MYGEASPTMSSLGRNARVSDARLLEDHRKDHGGPVNTDPTCYQGRPLAFLMHYVARRRLAHVVILISVLLAVICSVCTQYGLKKLIDVVSLGPVAGAAGVWSAFFLLCVLITADNSLWRVGGWVA